MKPPEQLKNCLFCRIRKGEKRPFEVGWQKEENAYDYEQIQKYNDYENYGVLAGFGGLALIDDDSEEQFLIKTYEKNFPESFKIRGHIYVFLEGWDGHKKKMYFNPEGKTKEEKKEIGEIQGYGTQGVCAGSLHPSGEFYRVEKNLPIAKIKWDDFKKVFGKFMKKESPSVENLKPVKNNSYEDSIDRISITSIFNPDLSKCPSCGCKTGRNFRVYPQTNSYFCFHSWSGGGIWEAIAISEGIKNCSEIESSCLDDSEKKKIIEVAKEKYGLKIKEQKKDWWADKINIKRFAELKDFIRCPKCNKEFDFDEDRGFYKCEKCGDKGNITKFIEKYLKCLQDKKPKPENKQSSTGNQGVLK